MTDRKDFKRVVRARARRVGESYSSALRTVRSAQPRRSAAERAAASFEGDSTMSMVRAIPDVRSTKVDKTIRLYTDLLGFDVKRGDDRVVAFTSATHPGVEVTLNRDGFSLPPGFAVEVDTPDTVRALYERAAAASVRVIVDPGAACQSFSVLDPSGRRVTIAAADDAPAQVSGDTTRPINRAIPGVTTNDLEATRQFYVDYLGFANPKTTEGVAIFRAPDSLAQVIASNQESASPDGFDLDVGTIERVEHIYEEAKGACIVLGAPEDFAQHGIRCFTMLDPNGIALNIAALLEPRRR